jgi:hypothetical protein
MLKKEQMKTIGRTEIYFLREVVKCKMTDHECKEDFRYKRTNINVTTTYKYKNISKEYVIQILKLLYMYYKPSS